jgi:hypothetical protein
MAGDGSEGITHFQGCHDIGAAHYHCALREITRLQHLVAALEDRIVDEIVNDLGDPEDVDDAG